MNDNVFTEIYHALYVTTCHPRRRLPYEDGTSICPVLQRTLREKALRAQGHPAREGMGGGPELQQYGSPELVYTATVRAASQIATSLKHTGTV